MPSNSKLLPFRSNIPYLSQFCFNTIDTEFPKRAKNLGGGFIIAGENLYLGVRGVIAKSFARIHKANLINNGIVPLEFKNEADYNEVDPLDELVIDNIKEALTKGSVKVKNISKNSEFEVLIDLTEKEIQVIKAGGRLNYVKNLG